MIALILIGSFMIFSAELGNSGDPEFNMMSIIYKQVAFSTVGLIAYFVCVSAKFQRFNEFIMMFIYIVIFILLLSTRIFGSINGAYGWIPIGPLGTIQPSEFAKAYMIILACKLIGRDHGEELNEKYFNLYIILSMVYFVIIFLYQKDLGSSVVLFLICFFMALVPSYKGIRKQQFWMKVLMGVGIVGVIFLLSPQVTDMMMSHSDNYMIGRFLAAANPFLFQYGRGYHVIMSLVSFAKGGMFGSGYGNSIHKYMNFPNQSNDFILPIIVEETGFVGFVVITVLYLIIMFTLYVHSIKSKSLISKITYMGVIVYIASHFILNVGGVAGFIPLTGVPLLMISSGSSSAISCMIAIGLAQHELIQQEELEEENQEEKAQ